MAPNIRIPEGFVFIPREKGVAVKLIDAARKAKADTHTSVRTVTGGYHVLLEVAERYQAEFPDAKVESTEEEVEEEAETPSVNADSTVKEIDAYAEEAGVDLSSAKNKAEKLALIDAHHNTEQEEE